LNLMLVQVPLIVTVESGVSDILDREGSRTPIEFKTGLELETRVIQ
jgi:aspartate--ammonia ligase